MPRLLEWIGLIERIRGRDGTPYLTRVRLIPGTPWGQLVVHILHRADHDPDPHDHPWDFWTLPLRSYLEEVLDHRGLLLDAVPAWTWSRRSAHHTHRFVGPARNSDRGKSVVTLVWRCRKRRAWGFWVNPDIDMYMDLKPFNASNPAKHGRVFIPWERYVSGPPPPLHVNCRCRSTVS